MNDSIYRNWIILVTVTEYTFTLHYTDRFVIATIKMVHLNSEPLNAVAERIKHFIV